MPNLASLLLNFAIAVGIGLLISAERERREGGGPARSPAGIRRLSATPPTASLYRELMIYTD